MQKSISYPPRNENKGPVYTIPFSFRIGLGMAIRYEFFFVYTIPFSLHIELGFCLHEKASLCNVMVSLLSVCIHCAFCAAPWMNGRLVDLIMIFRIELIPDLTDRFKRYRIGFTPFSDRFHLKCAVGMQRVRMVRSRLNRRRIRYEMKTVSRKRGQNWIHSSQSNTLGSVNFQTIECLGIRM